MTGTFTRYYKSRPTYVLINENNSQGVDNIKVITLIKLTDQPI